MFCNQLYTYFNYKKDKLIATKLKFHCNTSSQNSGSLLSPGATLQLLIIQKLKKNIAQFHELTANLLHIKAR